MGPCSYMLKAVEELWEKTLPPLTEKLLMWDFLPVVFDLRQKDMQVGISFHTFAWQLSAFSLCSSGLIFALVVLSTIHLFMKVSFSADVILCGLLGLKHRLTNYEIYWNYQGERVSNVPIFVHVLVTLTPPGHWKGKTGSAFTVSFKGCWLALWTQSCTTLFGDTGFCFRKVTWHLCGLCKTLLAFSFETIKVQSVKLSLGICFLIAFHIIMTVSVLLIRF